MLNLNQHYKQLLLTMLSMSIVNLEYWREKDTLTPKSERLPVISSHGDFVTVISPQSEG